ncbi:MAG: hypothetical protein AB3N23_03825 [Paracoccaceae bacterium]
MKRSLPVAAVALAISAFSASADEYSKYGEVDGWTVYRNETVQTCLIERVREDHILQMGWSQEKEGQVYLGVYVPEDIGRRDNQRLDLVIDLDGKRYTTEARTETKRITEGYEGGYFVGDNVDFWEDVARKYVMTIFPDDENALTIDLDGTFNAMTMAMKCGEESGS